MSPIQALFRSRKFLLAMFDVFGSLTSYFVTKYVAPNYASDVMIVIGTLQPVFIALIGTIAYEDNAQVRASADVQVAEEVAKADIKIAAETSKADVLIAVENAKSFVTQG